MYEWAVTMRNDRMGFVKSFDVEAKNYRGAILRSEEALREQGYDREAFAVIEVKRGREIGT